MAEQKPSSRERVKEIVAGIEENIQELFQSEKYFDYLRTMSRFHGYSVNNTILIYTQRPDAVTPIAGFRKWQQFGRHVKKGEKGLTIIAPTPLKKKIEEMKLDPDTKAPMLDQDGNVILEEKVVEIPLFRPVKVFSADQTEGKPLPSLSADLTGDVAQYEAFMDALRQSSPVPIEITPLDPDVDGLFSQGRQRITLREGMSQVQTVCAAVHEIAHAVLHNREKDRLISAAGHEGAELTKAKDKNTMEVEAESVSFAVCQYYGIDTSENSLGYIATWSNDRSLPELKASLDTITKTVNSLITSIDKHFALVCKQRGIDTAALQEEPDTPEKFTSDFFAHLNALHEAGVIPAPFTYVKREELESAHASYMRLGDFEGLRYILRDVEEKADDPTTTKLRNRLETLSDQWDAKLICKVEPLFGPETISERAAVRTYREQDGKLFSGEVVFSGTLAECNTALAMVENGTLTLRQVRQADFEVPSTQAPLENTVLDEYPLPDTTLSDHDLVHYGYSGGDLLPLSRYRASALLAQDVTIYALRAGNEPEMVFDREDFIRQAADTMFAVSREEWESSQDFRQFILNRMDCQEAREKAFLNHAGDCFAIYQLRQDSSTRYLRYEALEHLQKDGRQPLRNNYELAYTGTLTDGQGPAALEQLWEKFNINHPPDYLRPSMSVSDIVALKQDGVVSFHYCDSIGFQPVPNFIPPENYLKNAEMKLEDDYNMLDGILNNGPKATAAELEQQARSGQPIPLMDLAEADRREREERKSVLAKLNAKTPQREREKQRPKEAQKRSDNYDRADI